MYPVILLEGNPPLIKVTFKFGGARYSRAEIFEFIPSIGDITAWRDLHEALRATIENQIRRLPESAGSLDSWKRASKLRIMREIAVIAERKTLPVYFIVAEHDVKRIATEYGSQNPSTAVVTQTLVEAVTGAKSGSVDKSRDEPGGLARPE
jgi:hypothetical protein